MASTVWAKRVAQLLDSVSIKEHPQDHEKSQIILGSFAEQALGAWNRDKQSDLDRRDKRWLENIKKRFLAPFQFFYLGVFKD